MKTLSFYLLIMAVLCAGCNKGATNVTPVPPPTIDPNKPTGQTFLLSKATYGSAVDTYSYDDQNRVIQYNSGRLHYEYKYDYDANGNLLKTTCYDSSNKLLYTEQYTYSANRIDADHLDPKGKISFSYSYHLNSQKLVDSLSGVKGRFVYDNRNNLASQSEYCCSFPDDVMTYDTKKNPLSMIGAKNYHLMYFAYYYPQTFVNNMLSDTFYPETIAYKYNTDGFPVSANAILAGDPYSITFDYITK